jgi:hypothetical protein
MVKRFLCLLFLLALSASAQTPRIPPPESVNRNQLLGAWLNPGLAVGSGDRPSIMLDAAYAKPGLVHNAVYQTTQAGRVSTLFSNGANTWIAVGLTDNLRQEATISTWVYPSTTSVGAMQVAMSHSAGNQQDFNIEINRAAGKVSVVFSDALILTSTGTIPALKWSHIATTRSGLTSNWTVRVYINGVKSGETNTVRNPNGVSASTYIGAGALASSKQYFLGNLNDIRFYNRALSAAEIAAIYRGLQ